MSPYRSDEQQDARGEDPSHHGFQTKSRFRQRNHIRIPRYPYAIDRPNRIIEDVSADEGDFGFASEFDHASHIGKTLHLLHQAS
jgi:hypothetical protein